METDDCFNERLVYSDSENSDADETIDSVSKATTTQMSEDCLSPTSKEPTEAIHSDQNQLSNDSDEGDFNKSIKKIKKNARILCSDDESDHDNNDNEPQTNGTGNDTQIEGYDDNTTEHQAKINVRPTICDSDTKSSSDGNRSDAKNPPTKSMKKLKKKKKSEPRKRVISNQSDSESNDENPDKSDKKQKKSTKRKNISDRSGSSGSTGSSSKSGSGSNSASDSNSSAHDGNEASNASQIVKPREKTVQRVFIREIFLTSLCSFVT